MTPQENMNYTKLKRKIRWAVSFFFFGQGLAFASWASRIPEIKTQLNISEGALGTLLLMMPLGQIVTMSLSGRLVTKFGSKRIIPFASICYGLTLCSIGLVTNSYYLGLCLFIFGIFGSMGNIAVNTQAVTIERLYKKSIMSSFHGAWSLAGFVGALFGLISLQLNLSTLKHFAFILVLMIINALMQSKKLLEDGQTESKSKGLIKPDATIIQLGIICFLVMATEGAMFDWSGVYFKEVVAAPEKWIPLGYTAFMITMATGRFVGDKVLTVLGKRKTLQLSGILMSVGLLLSVLFPNLFLTTLAFMLVGFGVATVVPTVYSLAGQHKTIASGQALALVSSISFFGFLLGPPMIGYIAEWTNLKYSYAICATFGLVLFLLVSKLKVFKSLKGKDYYDLA